MQLHYALTNISIGIWSAGGATRKLLLSLPDRKLFVLVVVHIQRQCKKGALGRALQQVNQLLDKRNPFSNLSSQGERHAIVALELEWDAVVGTDFLFPLHQDARLVLEARLLTKRLFQTMADVEHFYGWKNPGGGSFLSRGPGHPDPRLVRVASLISKRSLSHSATPAARQQPAAPAQQPPQQQRLRPRRSRSLKVRALQQSSSLRRGAVERAAGAGQPLLEGLEELQRRQSGPDRLLCPSSDSSCWVAATHEEQEAWAAAAAAAVAAAVPMPQHPAPEYCDGAEAGVVVTPSWCTAGEQYTGMCESGWRCAAGQQQYNATCETGPLHESWRAPGEQCSMEQEPGSTCTSTPDAGQCSLQYEETGTLGLRHRGGEHRGRELRQLSWPAPLLEQQRSYRQQRLPRQQPGGAPPFDPFLQLGAPTPSEVPAAARWTTAAATYSSRTLVINFRDAALTNDLRVFVQSDMRLLKLYESGLPAWAIFLPSYGLPYHPWMRRATWLLFIVLSFVSMACGFYDLYKNIPFVKEFVTSAMARIHLPAAAVFEWLERHTQIRLSILLTWLFSRSPLFTAALRALRSGLALASQLLAPAARALAPAAATVAAALRAAAQPLLWACSSAALALAAAAAPVAHVLQECTTEGLQALRACVSYTLSPVLYLLSGLVQLLVALWAAAHDLLSALAAGPALLLATLWAGAVTLWAGLAQGLAPAAALARDAALALAAAGRAVAASLAAAGPLLAGGRRVAAATPAARESLSSLAAAAAASGGPSRLSAELGFLLDFTRSTGSRCFKAAQAVANGALTCAMAVSRHRVSLLLQAKQALPHALSAPPLAPGALPRDGPPSEETAELLDAMPLAGSPVLRGEEEEDWGAAPPPPACLPTASPNTQHPRSAQPRRPPAASLPGFGLPLAAARLTAELGPADSMNARARALGMLSSAADAHPAGSRGELRLRRRSASRSLQDMYGLYVAGEELGGTGGTALYSSLDAAGGLALHAGAGSQPLSAPLPVPPLFVGGRYVPARAGPGSAGGRCTAAQAGLAGYAASSSTVHQDSAPCWGSAPGPFHRSSWSTRSSGAFASPPSGQGAGHLGGGYDPGPGWMKGGAGLQGLKREQGTGSSAGSGAQRKPGGGAAAAGRRAASSLPQPPPPRGRPPLERLSGEHGRVGGGEGGPGGAGKAGAAAGLGLWRYSAGCKEEQRGDGMAPRQPAKVQ